MYDTTNGTKEHISVSQLAELEAEHIFKLSHHHLIDGYIDGIESLSDIQSGLSLFHEIGIYSSSLGNIADALTIGMLMDLIEDQGASSLLINRKKHPKKCRIEVEQNGAVITQEGTELINVLWEIFKIT